ncbi:MAG: SAM-dependent methyltransferase [Candidatus Saccharibacteria bacterium]|nr:SAM-dependent methyltransferase [Candidatus Saccharibacteria bacterium]
MDKNHDFVGRGEKKIAEAIKALSCTKAFDNKVVLDIGSSTGGFTDYALKCGAKKVIAVEKGSHQMDRVLRMNPKVELHEKTDIFDFSTSENIDLVVADVSFVSMRKILHADIIKKKCQHAVFLIMIKPQFEASANFLERGIVKNETIRRKILTDFETWAKSQGFFIVRKHDNSLRGKTGNRERFYLMRRYK